MNQPAGVDASASDEHWWTTPLALLPQRADYAGLQRSWRRDLVAGLTVAVVALPLALGLGVTTGMGAEAGLITAIVAGFIAAVFGGSNVQVSGFSASMTVVIITVVGRFGPSGVYTVTVLAGLLLIVAAAFGLAQFLVYVPWPVVEGFTVGVAFIIVLQQVPAALGVPKPGGENTLAIATRAVWRLPDQRSGAAVVIFVVAVVAMVLAPRLHRSIPGPLLAVALATGVSEFWSRGVDRIGQLPHGLPAPSLPSLSPGRISELLGAAGTIAALAAIESLMSAKVADGMSDAPPHDPDRELLGQGVANMASAVFGGMPSTGVLARTAVNVRSGARTRMAAISHAVILMLVALFAGSLVAEIPLASLAGVLVVTALRTIDISRVKILLRTTRSDAAVFLVTTGATLAFDLILAVEIGLAVAVVLALRSVAKSSTITAEAVVDEIDADEEHHLLDEQIVTYRMSGALFFGAAERFLRELLAVSDVKVVILRLPQLQMLDATGARALGAIVEDLQRRNITVLLKGPSAHHLQVLRSVGALERLATERHVFADLDAAVAHARLHVARG